MSQSAQMIFDAAPLGAMIAFSDGAPRPPDRFKHKLRAWQGRNAAGRLIRKTSGVAGRPAAFTLEMVGLRSDGVIVLVVKTTFEVASALAFEVVETPTPGAILCLIPFGDDLELRFVASDQHAAAAWLQGNRYSRALFHEVRPGGAQRAIMLPDSLVA